MEWPAQDRGELVRERGEGREIDRETDRENQQRTAQLQWTTQATPQTHTHTLTVHLPFVREDDFPPPTWWVDGQGFLKALLNVWTPDAFGIRQLISRVVSLALAAVTE